MDTYIEQQQAGFEAGSNGGYYASVKPYMDTDGLFPDNILGDSYWVLSLCERKIGEDGEMYWRFVK